MAKYQVPVYVYVDDAPSLEAATAQVRKTMVDKAGFFAGIRGYAGFEMCKRTEDGKTVKYLWPDGIVSPNPLGIEEDE